MDHPCRGGRHLPGAPRRRDAARGPGPAQRGGGHARGRRHQRTRATRGLPARGRHGGAGPADGVLPCPGQRPEVRAHHRHGLGGPVVDLRDHRADQLRARRAGGHRGAARLVAQRQHRAVAPADRGSDRHRADVRHGRRVRTRSLQTAAQAPRRPVPADDRLDRPVAVRAPPVAAVLRWRPPAVPRLRRPAGPRHRPGVVDPARPDDHGPVDRDPGRGRRCRRRRSARRCARCPTTATWPSRPGSTWTAWS